MSPRSGGHPVAPHSSGERCAGAAPPCRLSHTSKPPAQGYAGFQRYTACRSRTLPCQDASSTNLWLGACRAAQVDSMYMS